MFLVGSSMPTRYLGLASGAIIALLLAVAASPVQAQVASQFAT